MSKQYYEVEVERIAIIKGKAFVKARGRGKAMQLAQRALDDNDGRIEWERGSETVTRVHGDAFLLQERPSDQHDILGDFVDDPPEPHYNPSRENNA